MSAKKTKKAAQTESVYGGVDHQPLKIVIVGHVDHGKSTLVGRLIHDTGSLPEGKLEAIQAMCDRRGMPFEWAFLMDALKSERDQGITIDSAQIWFSTALRQYVLIDAPGHKEFLKNMVSGAASADAAVLVIDAKEGVREQSRRHGYLLHLLGVRQVAVAVNKMDLVKYSKDRFDEVDAEIKAYLEEIGITPTFIIPVSSREGDLIAGPSTKMDWYEGPTIAEALDHFEAPVPPTDLPLRFPVQDVYKFDERRIIAGRIESGRLHVGDTLLFSPNNKPAKIASIEGWHAAGPLLAASAGQSVGVTLDEQIFVERGHVASAFDTPPVETNVFKARVFWLGHKPLTLGKKYTLKLATAQHTVEVQEIERVIDTTDLSTGKQDQVERNAVAEIVLRSREMMVLDEFIHMPRTGRFVLVEDYDIVGGGIISMEGYPDQRQAGSVKSTNIFSVDHRVTPTARSGANGHRPGIMWLTGLSGSGKSTLAIELERQLFVKGYQVYVLDGDNLRHGLSSDLGFSPDDRAENIRRVGEVAGLFADAGFLVITAFISPYRADRQRARAIRSELFNEIYVQADLETCEGRDPKGLYKKARKGEIEMFSGISAPYEEPANPDFAVDTGSQSVAESVADLMEFVGQRFGGNARASAGNGRGEAEEDAPAAAI
ncbi:MAG: adenylyl-sulfate kinase [Rhodospirillaceae bacterium]|jgi:bifunctional enzyme CysN/CysC|nr:adenylyl-sulfate kinase [Rhodospirillaceae bacterium]MBT5752177.1 adenylyl-sulfate kinase [Rhodospirillaceae bacterium]